MTPGLAALISPATTTEFFSEHWPNKPFVIHDMKAADLFSAIPAFKSLDTLLQLWPASVQVHLPDLSDEASAVDAAPLAAKKFFTNKMGLLFNNAEKLVPELGAWIDSLKRDLGLPAMTYGRSMVYATPDGRGTAPHFDQNINFVLQLQGTKKWLIAANENVVSPTQRHTMGQPIDPELEPYAALPMPLTMPMSASEIILKPGSMLFVPRGFWHSTAAEGDALALNFTFNQPAWIDLFTAALRSRLMLSPEWRDLADGVSSRDPEIRQNAEFTLDALLAELVTDLPNWQAADILGATEG